MKIEVNTGGVTLIREQGDKRIGKESTITFYIRNLLNAREGLQAWNSGERNPEKGYAGNRRAGTWRRFYPDRVGLTSCRQGVWNGRRGKGSLVYWHERYAIENAAEEFNKVGRVFYAAAAGD